MKRLLLFLWCAVSLQAQTPLSLSLQSRSASGGRQTTRVQWAPLSTALIVCDMWDLHHCKNAVVREGEMVGRLNEVLEKAREQGVLIIHAPSSCMKFYEATPARERARSAPAAARVPEKIAEWCRQLPAEEVALYPIDQSDGGEDDDALEHQAWAKDLETRGLNPRAPWTRQVEGLRIDQERDAISDSGLEIWNLLEARGVQNVILAGVHLNMCVAGRPFGLRQMARTGRNVVLLRDLTDSMYNPARWPFVSHQRGTELFIEHVEKRVCPTITSDQVAGGKPFRFSPATAGPKRLQVLLLGDSTTEASIPKLLAPEEPQLEDGIRILLAAEKDCPPVDVYNLGLSGEYIQRLLDSGRYERDVASKPQADYIFIRYGINDRSKREGFASNFPADFRNLIARLRKDHPKATLIPMTVIPYDLGSNNDSINNLVRRVAAEEQLPLFDIHPRYEAELKKGPNMLNYRRFALAKVPDALHPLVQPYVRKGAEPFVVVLDNRLDAHLGHLPGWFSDRHPNLAGYQVIASETARFLAELIRKRG
jgi:lysophospholipase L1-like esterase/nicotinamidase-related amidase